MVQKKKPIRNIYKISKGFYLTLKMRHSLIFTSCFMLTMTVHIESKPYLSGFYRIIEARDKSFINRNWKLILLDEYQRQSLRPRFRFP
jgi:hypothetical protein